MLLKLSNGNYFFVDPSTEGGYNYYYFDGIKRTAIDGGIYETEELQMDEDLTETVIRDIIDYAREYTPFEKELEGITWVEETELDPYEDFHDW